MLSLKIIMQSQFRFVALSFVLENNMHTLHIIIEIRKPQSYAFKSIPYAISIICPLFSV